jgi:hypothetical protein
MDPSVDLIFFESRRHAGSVSARMTGRRTGRPLAAPPEEPRARSYKQATRSLGHTNKRLNFFY